MRTLIVAAFISLAAVRVAAGASHLRHLRGVLAAGLVDELRLMIFPVVLGRGKRLFDDTAVASAFTLVHSSTTSTGVLITRYLRSGEVRTGTFEDVE